MYARYQRNPDGFREKYAALLEAGGSRPCRELLAAFGLDAREPSFWNMGLPVIEDLICELQELED